MKEYNVAVVGATGLVGQKMLQVLEEENFPVANLYPMASYRSAGKKIQFKGKDYEVEELTENSFDKPIDIALFSAGASTSKKFAPIAAEKGVIVIDNSSAWRMDEDVPLVVPEVNPDDLKEHKNIIANPNCSTIQAVVTLKPIYDNYGLKRVIYTTMQAVSGSGQKGVEDLQRGDQGGENEFYPYQISHNVIPHIDDFLEDGYTKEEMKMVNETRKILNNNRIGITATTTRVPVFYGHSEAINIETEKPFNIDDIRTILSKSPGIVVQDDPQNNIYPVAINSEGSNDTFVGRIREDMSAPNALNLWCVSDNSRKGAAANAVQIAKKLDEMDLIK